MAKLTKFSHNITIIFRESVETAHCILFYHLNCWHVGNFFVSLLSDLPSNYFESERF